MQLKKNIYFYLIRNLKNFNKQPYSSLSYKSQTFNFENLNKCQVEFNSGAGGVEAMIFANDLFEMYKSYAYRKNWIWQPIQMDNVLAGGLRSAVVAIEGESCYSMLRFEAGVHRVQRIPLTDKTRIHTSTASVAVLPEPDNPELKLTSNEVKIEAMRSSGPGGQNVNKKSSAVRLTHLPTGIAVKCMEERYQYDNIKIAYRRLASLILQQELDKLSMQYDSNRKLQVSSLARSAKIRTFNFKENRVTDHRLKYSILNLNNFLKGGESLDKMIELLQEAFVQQVLEEEQAECIRQKELQIKNR